MLTAILACRFLVPSFLRWTDTYYKYGVDGAQPRGLAFQRAHSWDRIAVSVPAVEYAMPESMFRPWLV